MLQEALSYGNKKLRWPDIESGGGGVGKAVINRQTDLLLVLKSHQNITTNTHIWSNLISSQYYLLTKIHSVRHRENRKKGKTSCCFYIQNASFYLT